MKKIPIMFTNVIFIENENVWKISINLMNNNGNLNSIVCGVEILQHWFEEGIFS